MEGAKEKGVFSLSDTHNTGRMDTTSKWFPLVHKEH